MTVSLTGGTGFVGKEVVKQLHAAGHSVRVLVRSKKSDASKRAADFFNAALVPGNIHNPYSLREFCEGSDAVIHLVGIIGEVGENTFERVHVRGTENIVTAAREAGIKRFVHMSALGTRPDAISRYHQTKFAAEEIVRKSGLDFTIFRPSVIYGRRDSFTNLFVSLSRFSPVLPVIGSGEGTFQPIRIKDLSQIFVNALNEPRSIGQTFDVGGPDVLTMNQLLDQLMEVLGRKRAKVHIPLGIARVMAALMGAVYPTFFGKTAPLNADQILMIQERTIGNVQPANELFGITPVTFKDGLSRYLSPSR